ncbi:hypothetical protein [Granulosicoccus antarcticus]|uniref:hypothetical protein n=1 Tax=Granulosicoccus antarcticus TaxID=437505 RepID=UPI0012FE10FA|nr:hypothetical protein [Granulosicoccus antarcticus]
MTTSLSATSHSGQDDNAEPRLYSAIRASPVLLYSSATPATCSPGCITVTDYQSESTPLTFSRSYNPSVLTPENSPPRWRHRYEIRLTQAGNDRIVFDHHGNRHRFTPNPDGSYKPTRKTDGELQLKDGQYRWTDEHEIQHRFYGSLPTSLHFPDQQTLTLHYQQGQLAFVSDDKNRHMEIVHDRDDVSFIVPSGEQLFSKISDPCPPLPPPTDPTDPIERCDTEANPVPGFLDIQSGAGVSTLDARPASCQSYFVEFYGTLRGEEIESGLEEHPPYAAMVPTNRSFPIIDFINGDELIVVRSRDLGSPSYNNPDSPDALYDRLLRDAQQIQTQFLDPLEADGSVSGTENGRTTHISYGEQQQVTLHLLVRQDMASPAHWQQIESARLALAERYGISLQVVIIP